MQTTLKSVFKVKKVPSPPAQQQTTAQTLTATITAVEEIKFVLITPINTSFLLLEDEVKFDYVKFAVEQNFCYKFLGP